MGSRAGVSRYKSWGHPLALMPRWQSICAVAERDAGLNIIAELFAFLQEQYAAGAVDRATVQRTSDCFRRRSGSGNSISGKILRGSGSFGKEQLRSASRHCLQNSDFRGVS